jgi:hypothetical protein
MTHTWSFAMLLCRPLHLLFVLMFLQMPAWAENIEQSMTTEEFKAAGLDKLSTEELARLNIWLQSRGQTGTAAAGEAVAAEPVTAPTPASTPATAPGAPPILARYRKNNTEAKAVAPETVDLVESRIVGFFEGWRRGTVFLLENGQHWRVSEDHRFETSSEEGPPVTIKAALMGSWLMRVGEYNRRVRVQRIK